jgi:membrane protease YdiL (CAAX protease family)
MDGVENKAALSNWGCFLLLLLFSVFFFDTPNRYWFFYKLICPGPDGTEPCFTAVCAAWVMSSALSLLGVAAGIRVLGVSLPEMGWKMPDRPLRMVFLGVLVGVAALLFNSTILTSILYKFQVGVWKLLPFSISDPRVGGNNAYNLFMGLIAWTFVPIFEELSYRGLIYTVVERRWGGILALILSSVIFAISHFYYYGDSFLQFHMSILNQFLKYLVCGLALGALRMRSGSLVPAIAGHSAINIGISIMAGFKG